MAKESAVFDKKEVVGDGLIESFDFDELEEKLQSQLEGELADLKFLKEEKDVSNPVMMQHEKIHIRQQIELFILAFFIWYGIEYFIRILQYKNKHLAYRNISFEREAYANESENDFLQKRRFWNFLKYLKAK